MNTGKMLRQGYIIHNPPRSPPSSLFLKMTTVGFRERNEKRKKQKQDHSIEFVSNNTADQQSDKDARLRMIQSALEDSDEEVSSFDDSDNEDSDSEADYPSGTTQKRKMGTFAGMGLLPALLKAIQKKGYRQPTPIQRKCIGPLLEGHDLVGMARTGSGKTAAFVLPMIQKLKAHSVKVGVRGLVLAPTRELAVQTHLFIQAMTKFTDLRSIVLVGGDAFEGQFTQLASNPDIIVASPGRLLHLCVETKFSLAAVEYVVFDEADRLFEMGFAEQLTELLALMPASRQTALFSATLPKTLVEFAAAGLTNPQLIRLDAESKLSEDLKCHFMSCSTDSKEAALLYLLKNVIRTDELTVVFAATKHHVEYLQELLKSFNFDVSYIYGSLDQEARELAIHNFRTGRSTILIVTDVAARGIDIPLLDNVINYDFPGKAKLFVHRVGRAARAGRSGCAYSLVSMDELPYLIDLQMFLGHKLVVGGQTGGSEVIGCFLQEWIDAEQDQVRMKVATVPFLEDLQRVIRNAYKIYYKTRNPASPEAHAQAKVLGRELLGSAQRLHPMFAAKVSEAVHQQVGMISAIRGYKPKQSHLAFELAKKGTSVPSLERPNKSANKEEATTNKTDAFKDNDFYMPYTKGSESDRAADRAYSVKESFMAQANSAVFDLGVGGLDDARKLRNKNLDRQKRNAIANQKRIKGEGGLALPASFKSGLYEKWQKKTHLSLPQAGDVELSGDKVASLAPKKRWITKKKSDRKESSFKKDFKKEGGFNKDFKKDGFKKEGGFKKDFNKGSGFKKDGFKKDGFKKDFNKNSRFNKK